MKLIFQRLTFGAGNLTEGFFIFPSGQITIEWRIPMPINIKLGQKSTVICTRPKDMQRKKENGLAALTSEDPVLF